MTEYSESELNEFRVMLAAIHPACCSRGDAHDWKECRTMQWLSNGATLDAVRHLREHPRDAAGARIILHDYVCTSGCTGAGAAEHAKRQAGTVAALRKYLTAQAAA